MSAQRTNARLVGSDVELMDGMVTGGYVSDIAAGWKTWSGILEGLPPKGERLDLGDGYWAHRDGLSAEYGFEPTTSLDQFMGRLQYGKLKVEESLGYPLVAVDSFDVSPIVGLPWAADYLDIGCQPDFYATPQRGIRRRSVPPDVRNGNTRECGGHIHISLPPPFLEARDMMNQFVIELDAVVYPLAIGAIEPSATSWYRKRRVFRPTPYGIEYRSLGAAALLADDAEVYLSLLFDMVASAWEV